jgi:hypothetical protein
MPLLSNIVANINAQIQAKLPSQEFQMAQYSGITIPITRTLKENGTATFPGVRVPNSKDAKAIVLDDKYNLIVYHKLVGNTYSVVEDEDYGDDYSIVKQVTTMQMVVWAQSSKVGFLSEHELESAISGAIFGQMNLKPFFSLFVAPTSTNYDKNSLFGQEFKGVSNILQNDHLYFAINYTIDSTFEKDCFSICDCTEV